MPPYKWKEPATDVLQTLTEITHFPTYRPMRLLYSRISVIRPKKIAVAGKTHINVTLSEDSQLLQEVVVVGYGVQRKSDLTGAVASVKTADALKSTPTGNVSDALQGRMAGVSVLSGSGDPAATTPSASVVSTLLRQKQDRLL